MIFKAKNSEAIYRSRELIFYRGLISCLQQGFFHPENKNQKVHRPNAVPAVTPIFSVLAHDIRS